MAIRIDKKILSFCSNKVAIVLDDKVNIDSLRDVQIFHITIMSLSSTITAASPGGYL